MTTSTTDSTAATDTTSDTTSDTTTTESTTTSETSTPTSTDTTDATSTTTEATTSTTDATTSTTTGVVPPELDAACQSLCEKFIECDWEPAYRDVEDCKVECVGNTPGGMCLDSSLAYYACASGLTCDELLEEEWVACAEEEAAIPDECSAPDCEPLGSNEGEDTCSIGYLCPNSVAEELRCEGDTCTCLVDGEPVGMCGASEGFCGLETYEQADIAFECCGFDF